MLIYITGLILSNVIFMLSIERFMGVFFEKRRTAFPVMVCSYLLFLIVSSLERLFLSVDLSHVLVTLPLLFIIALNYESSVQKKFVAVVCNYLLTSIAVTLVFRLDDFFSVSRSYRVGILPLVLIASALAYLIALLLRKFKRIRSNDVTLPVFWVFALLILASLITIFAFYFFDMLLHVFVLFPIILLAFILVFFYMYNSLSTAYEDKLKLALHAQEKEYHLTQFQLMRDSAERMKSFQHDMRNHLTTLKDYSQKGKPEEITEYLERLLAGIEKGDIYSDTGNLAFDSIINHKLRNAESKHIQLDLRLSIPSELNMDVADIVTIFGNLLDNALDAVEKAEEKILKLDIEFGKGCLYAKIENSFNSEVRYSDEEAGEERQITSLKSGEGHGYGLKNIRQAVGKYNGHVEISHDDNIFSVGILMYVGDN